MRAFLILGPESSGTRLLAEILVKAGCRGEYSHEQEFDKGSISGECIVWRRSVPHAQKHLPEFSDEVEKKLRDYDVHVLVPTRGWHAMLMSQVRRGHVKGLDLAHKRTQRAYLDIFNFLGEVQWDFTVVSYEGLTHEPKYLDSLLDDLGLPGVDIELRDENSKHYT